MKKMKFLILISCLLFTFAGAVQEAVAAPSSEGDKQQLEFLLFTQFQEWAQKGDANAFAQYILKVQYVRAQSSQRCKTGNVLVSLTQTATPVCVSAGLLLRTDTFGNNLLHSAKDVATVGAVGSLFRAFFPTDFTYINKLKNKKNSARETPLIAHTSRGDLYSFYQLYEGSRLEKAVKARANIGNDRTNLLFFSSNDILQEEILEWGTNAAGVNILSLVEQQPDSPERTDVLRFLAKNAPSLL